MLTVDRLVEEAHATAVQKGFWQDVPNGVEGYAVKLALIHSEVSECLEEFRRVTYFSHDKVAEELADVVIRVADLAGRLRLNLSKAIENKMAKNLQRPNKHGKSF